MVRIGEYGENYLYFPTENTPQAAAAIVEDVTRKSRKSLFSKHDTFSAFGVYPVVKKNSDKNLDANNANVNMAGLNRNNSNVDSNNSNR